MGLFGFWKKDKEPAKILPAFDFGAFDGRSAIAEAVDRMRQIHAINGFADDEEIPPIPERGMTPAELDGLERGLGITLPGAYRELLTAYRYLHIDDGRMIFGGEHEGVSYGSVWLSEDHETGRPWLVVGKYWVYADGDDLLMDPETGEVYVYLHDYRGKIERFAEDAKAALYRLAFELDLDELAAEYGEYDQ